MSSWQKISSKLVYQNPYCQYFEDQVITPDGRRSIYYQDTSLHRAVTIVPLDDRQNLYLIKENKYLPGEIITLPAGVSKKGENLLKTAKRELKEEAGLKAKKWQSLGYFWAAPGRSTHKGWIFLAQELTEDKQRLEGGEVIEVIKIPFKKAIEMIKNGKITDAWAIIPILKTKLFLGL